MRTLEYYKEMAYEKQKVIVILFDSYEKAKKFFDVVYLDGENAIYYVKINPYNSFNVSWCSNNTCNTCRYKSFEICYMCDDEKKGHPLVINTSRSYKLKRILG